MSCTANAKDPWPSRTVRVFWGTLNTGPKPGDSCTTGKSNEVTPAGTVKLMSKWSSVWWPSSPPLKVTTSRWLSIVQPVLATPLASVTSAGILKRMATVGDSSQPCSTPNATVTSVPAVTDVGSGSTWAAATPAVLTTIAEAAPHPAASRTRRPPNAARRDVTEGRGAVRGTVGILEGSTGNDGRPGGADRWNGAQARDGPHGRPSVGPDGSTGQGSSSTLPLVARPWSRRWASAVSARGTRRPISMSSCPSPIQPNSSPARRSSSSRVTV